MRFASEGYPFIGGFLAVTVGVGLVWPWLAPFPFVLTLFMLYFFRDPERAVPEEADVFISPADGKVILIQTVEGDAVPPLLSGGGKFSEISIFMSPLNVHVNRVPCAGIVSAVEHRPGRFISAFKPEASLVNESISMALETKSGKILLRQVAGFVARRAVCRKKPGDRLRAGERYGVIKFSSRVDLYLPLGAKVLVKPGDRVLAGETIVARL